MSSERSVVPGWNAYVEILLQRALEEGKFENLPGAGKPIPDLDQPYDENWWLKKLIQRENISLRPESCQEKQRDQESDKP